LKGGNLLFDPMALAIRALEFLFLIFFERNIQDERFAAILAKEFINGHGYPPFCLRVSWYYWGFLLPSRILFLLAIIIQGNIFI